MTGKIILLIVKIVPKIMKTILGIVAGLVWLDTKHKAATL